MPPKQTDPQFKLRLPGALKDRLETAAKKGGRTVSGEILARLELSFENAEGYEAIAELTIATLKENVLNSRRELEEYREMVGTIRLYRYVIERLLEGRSTPLPSDLQTFVGMMMPARTEKVDEQDVFAMIKGIYNAMLDRERVVEEHQANSNRPLIEDTLKRLQKIVGKESDDEREK